MKIQIHNGLSKPQEIKVTRVLVLDDFDNPIAVAMEVDNGVILAETASAAVEFQQLLRNLGIHKMCVVHDVDPATLPEIH